MRSPRSIGAGTGDPFDPSPPGLWEQTPSFHESDDLRARQRRLRIGFIRRVVSARELVPFRVPLLQANFFIVIEEQEIICKARTDFSPA